MIKECKSIKARLTWNYMGSSSYLSIFYTVILLLRVWGRVVTRKNGKNSDNFFNSSLQSLADLNFVISQRKMSYTFKKGKNMKWPLVTGILGQLLVMHEPVFL
jgi:hypothetical protein